MSRVGRSATMSPVTKLNATVPSWARTTVNTPAAFAVTWMISFSAVAERTRWHLKYWFAPGDGKRLASAAGIERDVAPAAMPADSVDCAWLARSNSIDSVSRYLCVAPKPCQHSWPSVSVVLKSLKSLGSTAVMNATQPLSVM
jgi:hypothetical protein